jgi:sepiapterin reductase
MQNVIIITGAGKGIGRSIAIEFSKRAKTIEAFNPHLVLCSRTLQDLESLADTCNQLGTSTTLYCLDISNLEDMNRMVQETIKNHGQINGLINNAGVGQFKPLNEMSEKDFDTTISINLKGTFFLTQSVFDHMKDQGSGHIFFITSVAAEKPFEQSAIYCMSKYGQKGLVEVMRLYGRKHNVRITNVLPGAVYTPMWGEVEPEMQNKMMLPEDISGPVVDAYLMPGRTCMEELVLRPGVGDL